MNAASRAVVAVAIAMLTSLMSAQVKSDAPLKPVSVCDILFDLPQFEGKNVAVLGRIRPCKRLTAI